MQADHFASSSLNLKKNVGSNLCETILLAANLLQQVRQGISLTQALGMVSSTNRSAAQSLTYDALRYKPIILEALKPFLHREIDPEVEDLLLITISTLFDQSQNQYTPYTLVNEAVNAAQKSLRTRHAKGLINAVLRKVIDRPTALDIHVMNAQYPSWWVKNLKKAYPDNLQSILETNLKPAKMFLRINSRKISKELYSAALQTANIQSIQIPAKWQDLAPHAIALERSMPVQFLPGFNEGWFSVQDLGAQLAAQILGPLDGEKILDACSAPGGKASHLLEIANIDLDILEISDVRMVRVKENLLRLDLQANCIVGNAAEASAWWQNTLYDAILADVPCSATGIMRRHPDILYLRRHEDIAQLQTLQRKIISELWQLLKPGGRMLFVSCSILPQEGGSQFKWFAENLQDALRLDCLEQLLPNEWHDGFFYGLLKKNQ